MEKEVRLVRPLEWWDGRALLLVEGVAVDGAVGEVDLAVGGLLIGEGVLHPFLVVTLGVVLAGVGTAGFLAVGGSNGGLGTRSNH